MAWHGIATVRQPAYTSTRHQAHTIRRPRAVLSLPRPHIYIDTLTHIVHKRSEERRRVNNVHAFLLYKKMLNIEVR